MIASRPLTRNHQPFGSIGFCIVSYKRFLAHRLCGDFLHQVVVVLYTIYVCMVCFNKGKGAAASPLASKSFKIPYDLGVSDHVFALFRRSSHLSWILVTASR